MENSNYLGTEKVGKLLRQFAIPCICSLIISCLYNIVDQIFVGNGVGYLGNAATGVIIFAMMPLAMTQNTLASIIRADGSPKYAMTAMLTGAVINIIGDPVAIFALDMGIQGAAWATILGQFVSFLFLPGSTDTVCCPLHNSRVLLPL